MLPLTILKTAENHPMLIELKNGDTYNGKLVSCNMYMNICLKDVICTSRDGDRFWKIPECYIRGTTIKYLRIPDEVMDMAVEDSKEKKQYVSRGGGGRGGRMSGRFGSEGGRGGGGGRGHGRDQEGGRGYQGRGGGQNNRYASKRGRT